MPKPVELRGIDREDRPSDPFTEILPGGDLILTTVIDLEGHRGPERGVVSLGDLVSGEITPLVENAMQARYSATGHLT